jgi:hypothetical protein
MEVPKKDVLSQNENKQALDSRNLFALYISSLSSFLLRRKQP